MLPNFLCIGAQKCGTTTIAHILQAHPGVYLARGGETRFFCDEFQYLGGVQRYEIQQFSGWNGQPAVGEKCPEYLYVPGTAQRIFDLVGPRVKLIVALRSPAQRAFSHYRHNFTMLRESRSFDEALADDAVQVQQGLAAPPPFGYLARGFYARQLAEYLNLFAPEQFLFVHFEEDIASDQRGLCEKICTFLDIEKFFPAKLPFRAGHARLETLSVRFAEGGSGPSQPTVEIEQRSYRVWRAAGLLQRLLRQAPRAASSTERTRIHRPSEALVHFARRFQENKPKGADLPRERELAINRRFFQDDFRRLSEIAPLDLSRWLED